MKKDQVEQWILLEQSGELGAFNQWRLRRELRTNADARAFRDDLLALTRTVKDHAVDGPSAAVMDTIRRAASEAASRSEEFVIEPATPSFAWRPAFSLAGVALLVICGWLLVRQSDNTAPQVAKTDPAPSPAPVVIKESVVLAWEDDDIETQLDAISQQLAMNGSEWNESTSSDEADVWATELLESEGAEI